MSAGEGKPQVTLYNYASDQFMAPAFYGTSPANAGLHYHRGNSRTGWSVPNNSHSHSHNYNGILSHDQKQGLGISVDNKHTRMNRPGYAPLQNYMKATGESPMNRGGPNLFPSVQRGFDYLTDGDILPPTARPQNANEFPAMFNEQTGLRIDPQSRTAGLVMRHPITRIGLEDRHNPTMVLEKPRFNGISYLSGPSSPSYGASSPPYGAPSPSYRLVKGGGDYTYKQYADGSIKIHVGPTGTGTVVTKGTEMWKAITNEIGPYPSETLIQKKDGKIDLWATAQKMGEKGQESGVIQSLFDTFLASQKTKQAELEAQAAAYQAQATGLQQSQKPGGLEKALPYILTIGGILGVGAVVYAVTK